MLLGLGQRVKGVCRSRFLALIQSYLIISKVNTPMPGTVKTGLSAGGSLCDPSAFRIGCIAQGGPKSFVIITCLFLNLCPGALLFLGVFLVGVAKLYPVASRTSERWPDVDETIVYVFGTCLSFFVLISDFAVKKGFAWTTHPCGQTSLTAYPFLLTDDVDAVAIRYISICDILV